MARDLGRDGVRSIFCPFLLSFRGVDGAEAQIMNSSCSIALTGALSGVKPMLKAKKIREKSASPAGADSGYGKGPWACADGGSKLLQVQESNCFSLLGRQKPPRVLDVARRQIRAPVGGGEARGNLEDQAQTPRRRVSQRLRQFVVEVL